MRKTFTEVLRRPTEVIEVWIKLVCCDPSKQTTNPICALDRLVQVTLDFHRRLKQSRGILMREHERSCTRKYLKPLAITLFIENHHELL